MNVLILQNITREGPGLLEDVLHENDIESQVVNLDLADPLPAAEDFDALVVLGGPDSANDETDKMREELAFVGDWLEQGKPYLGICLGLQVGVRAAGGDVLRGDVKEVGFRDGEGELNTVELTDEGFVDPLFAGLASPFKVFHLHGETVELTDDMELLGVGEDCRNQVVKIGPRAYGLQCHFELTEQMLGHWLAEDEDLLEADQQLITDDWQMVKTEYTLTGRTVLQNFLELIGAE